MRAGTLPPALAGGSQARWQTRYDDGGMGFNGRIRSAAASDAAEMARIYVVSWNEGFGHLLGMRKPPSADGERWTGELTSGRARWWVAETGHRVAGFAGICPSRDPAKAGLGGVPQGGLGVSVLGADPQALRAR